jgi:uncharacterized protein YjbJ (UPF0337 family)
MPSSRPGEPRDRNPQIARAAKKRGEAGFRDSFIVYMLKLWPAKMSKEEIKGRGKEAEGKVRKGVGKLARSKKQQAKGAMEEAEGKAEVAAGKAIKKAKKK